jgi:dolichol-phosphate mannosyltransferase
MAMECRSLSVVVTARNEVGNLRPAVEIVLKVLANSFGEYELLLVNDGSTDGTGALADELSREHPSIRVAHHRAPQGFAASYRHGVDLARMAYVGLVTGDNEMKPESIQTAFAAVGKADVVVPYQANQSARPWWRRSLSRFFTGMVNVLFGLRLRYFQGPCIYPTPWARSLPVTTRGFALLTDMLVRSIKAGCTYVEVPMYVQARGYGRSAAVSFRNVVTALWILGVLFRDIYIRRQPVPAGDRVPF